MCFAHTVFFLNLYFILTSTTAPSPVNLVSFVIFELLGGAVAAGLFRLTEMETTAAKDEKVKICEDGDVAGDPPLKLTANVSEDQWLEDDIYIFLGGWHILGSYLSFREGS